MNAGSWAKKYYGASALLPSDAREHARTIVPLAFSRKVAQPGLPPHPSLVLDDRLAGGVGNVEAWSQGLADAYEAGHGEALIAALLSAWNLGFEVPTWAQREFCLRANLWTDGIYDSLEKAFNIKRHGQAGARAKRRHYATQIYLDVRAASKSGVNIGEVLFAEIGKSFDPPISASTIERMYASVRNKVGANSASERSISASASASASASRKPTPR